MYLGYTALPHANTEVVPDENDALTDVTSYQVKFIFWFLEHFACLAQEVQIAGAMEAIFAHCIFFIQLIRQSIHVRVRRHSLVESCVKDCNLRPTPSVKATSLASTGRR